MGFYRKYILPRATHFACSLKPTMLQRGKVVPLASGRVLEIGIGSGLNLPFYAAGKVEHLWGLDPSRENWALTEGSRASVDFGFEFLQASADSIPLDDASADCVLMTYTLCSLPAVRPALEEMRRVLKPEGQLIFCEHGTAPDARVRRWQYRLNPLWRRVSGGCNLNRTAPELLQQGGFTIQEMEAAYIPGWKPASYNYWGIARPVRFA
ncbi:MAG: class I SAM-dependent methyltransferase [Gammaproteobacteria bacterium]